jgi:DNA-directed RNA polymerase specialized sigma24 family protein
LITPLNPTMPADRPIDLLSHADSLYAVAHALTMNASEAAALVQATYRRASSSSPPPDFEPRLWLLGILREEAGLSADALPMLGSASATGDFRRTLAEKAARRVLPIAFAHLSAADREILVLHLVERLDVPAISSVVKATPDVTEARIAVAGATLRTAVLNELAPGEKGLIGELPEGWLRDAMNDMAVRELPVMPPTLRTSLETPTPSTLDHASQRSVPKPAESRANLSQRLQRALAIASIVFFTGLIGYVVSRVLEAPEETGVIALSVRASDRARVELATDRAEDVEVFLEERVGWRVRVPEIEGAQLIGVRITEAAPGARVPTIVYSDDDDGGRLVVMAYSYALIDQHPEALQFDRETLQQIEEEGRYDLHDLGSKQVLVWRQRNTIFVAVTEGQAEALHERVYRSS